MLVDALTIPRLLQRSGFTENEAAHAFGLYNHGLPLVQLVAMLAGAVSSAIVPFIAEAHAAGKASAIQTNTELAVRLTWLVGIAATAGLSVLAWPINVMFFRSPDGWETIAILAGTALFSTLTTVMASLLQGLGKAGLPAQHMLWATVVKIGLNLTLVGAYGINGAAWSAVLAFALAAVLNGISLRRITGVSFSFGRFLVRPIAAVLLMILVVWLIMNGLRGLLDHPGVGNDRLRETVIVLAAVAGGALLYIGEMLRFGCITAQDIMLLGGKGERLGAVLRRLRLLPRS
jgi:O-antigen/teichoic acid export membrane protein